jgi:hypothetical protein
MNGFHKDTTGDTIFANLNYFTSVVIQGPQFVANPPQIDQLQNTMRDNLPKVHMKDLKLARGTAGDPTEIEAAGDVAAFGGVVFSDQFIHHATPELQHRATYSLILKRYLDQKGIPYDEAEYKELEFRARSRANILGLDSAFAPPITRQMMKEFGLKNKAIDEILWISDERYRRANISNRALGGGAGARDIPYPDNYPALKRRASYTAMKAGGFPDPLVGRRSFLRTWVRVVKR